MDRYYQFYGLNIACSNNFVISQIVYHYTLVEEPQLVFYSKKERELERKSAIGEKDIRESIKKKWLVP